MWVSQSVFSFFLSIILSLGLFLSWRQPECSHVPAFCQATLRNEMQREWQRILKFCWTPNPTHIPYYEVVVQGIGHHRSQLALTPTTLVVRIPLVHSSQSCAYPSFNPCSCISCITHSIHHVPGPLHFCCPASNSKANLHGSLLSLVHVPSTPSIAIHQRNAYFICRYGPISNA